MFDNDLVHLGSHHTSIIRPRKVSDTMRLGVDHEIETNLATDPARVTSRLNAHRALGLGCSGFLGLQQFARSRHYRSRIAKNVAVTWRIGNSVESNVTRCARGKLDREGEG